MITSIPIDLKKANELLSTYNQINLYRQALVVFMENNGAPADAKTYFSADLNTFIFERSDIETLLSDNPNADYILLVNAAHDVDDPVNNLSQYHPTPIIAACEYNSSQKEYVVKTKDKSLLEHPPSYTRAIITDINGDDHIIEPRNFDAIKQLFTDKKIDKLKFKIPKNSENQNKNQEDQNKKSN